MKRLIIFVLFVAASAQVVIQGPVRIQGPIGINSTPTPITICTVTTASQPNGTQNTSYTGNTMTTSGCTAPLVWSYATSGIPGVTVNGSTGLLSGTPTTPGTYNFQIQAVDSHTPAQTAKHNYTVVIASVPPPPQCQINTASVPGGQVTVVYSGVAMSTSNCTGPLLFSIVNPGTGTLPPGLSITNTATGLIGGTPTNAGTYPFTMQVVDSHLPAQTATSKLSIVIAAAPPPPCVITTVSEPPAQVGVAYSSNVITTTGCIGTVSFATTNPSIPGLTFNTANGQYTGTPTTAATYPFTVTGTDQNTPPSNPTVNLNIAVAAAATQADNRYCNTNGTTNFAQPTDGPATLPTLCNMTAMSNTPATGGTVTATAGSLSSAQSTINAAACGTTVFIPALLSPGVNARYSGTLTVSNVCPANNWLWIVTDQTAALPVEGARATPAWINQPNLPFRDQFAQPTGGAAFLMPTFISTGTNSTIKVVGASHVRFIGIHATTTKGQQVQNPIVSVDTASNNIIWDRGLINGGDSISGQSTDTIEVGFRSDSVSASVIDSSVWDIHCVYGGICQDNYAIFGGGATANATGPDKDVDNYLEAAGQCFLSGGGGTGSTTALLSNVEFRRNHCFKPTSWYANSPNFGGTLFDVKNCFELKNADKVLFEANHCDNLWEGQSDQFATMILLGAKNQASALTGTGSTAPSGSGGGAANWATIPNPPGVTTPTGFDIRQSNNEWYMSDRTTGTFWKSFNKGSSWTNITSNITAGLKGLSIQVDQHSGTLIASTGLTVQFWRSTDDGATWSQISPTGFHANPISAITGCAMPSPTGVGNLVCGGYFSSANSNAWYSTNLGATATTVTNYTPAGPGGTTGLGRNPADGSYWLGTEAAGFWKSTDGGNSFTQIITEGAGQGNIYGITFDTAGDPIFTAQGGVWKGSGSGISYTFTNTFTVGNQGRGMLTDSTGAIYWGHNSSTTAIHSVYRSTDNGNSFQIWDTGVPNQLDSNHYTEDKTDAQVCAIFFNDSTNVGQVYCSPQSGAAPQTGILTWASGQQFNSNQVSSQCATPFHCNVKFNNVTYQVQSVTDATHIVIAPNPGTQATQAFTAYLPGLNPNAQVTNITVRWSQISHALRGLSVFMVPSDGGDIAKTTGSVAVHDDVFEDISTIWAPTQGGCCAWASVFQVQNSFAVPNNVTSVAIWHTTDLAFQNSFTYSNGNVGPSGGFGFAGPLDGGVPNLLYYDNVSTAGWNGSASSCNTATDSVLNRFKCYDANNGNPTNTYCYDHNMLAITTQGSAPNNGVTSVSPYPGAADSPGCPFTTTGQLIEGSFAAFQFVNLNGGSGGDYHLQVTSPGHNAAHDGLDMGANITQLNMMLAGVD